MKKITRYALLGFIMIVLIACNIPGCETERSEQEYNYKLDQMARDIAATENAQTQGSLDKPDSSGDAPVESESGPANTEVPGEADATTPKMVFEGTGTVVEYPWSSGGAEDLCHSEAKVTLTVEGDTCEAKFFYQQFWTGPDGCFSNSENTWLVTGPYSSVDGSCTFNTIKQLAGGSVDGAGVLMGWAKVDFWIQHSTEEWRTHCYSDYLSPQP